jgi:hypothetical protein
MDIHGAAGAATWWRPRRLGWWVAVGFMVGAALFALGSFPPYFRTVAPETDAVTFFVGSIFFTTAAAGQLTQAVQASGRIPAPRRREWRRPWTWGSQRLDLWAAIIQFVGTLCFNASTLRAIDLALDTAQENRLVWRPDVFGSIAFLVASYLAVVSATGRRWSWSVRSRLERIAQANFAGSVAFGAAAICAYTLSTTGTFVNVAIVNAGTFIGGICFLIGAALLIPLATGDPA